MVMKRVRLGRYILAASSLPTIVLLLAFVYAFLSNDFGMLAVYQASSASLNIWYKLLASWTDAGGSLFLLITMMAVGLLVYEVRALMIHEESRVTSLIVSFLIIYFLIAVVMVNPFMQIGSSLTNGLGLSPSLQSFWAGIHPPLVFAAYTAVLFAYCNVLSKRWSKQGDRLADGRLLTGSWILLTLGIALGGTWAYQTLGWGGYWSWDPIETSALVPWLALMGVLFARRLGNLGLELLGMTFAMSTLLFTSYTARGSAAPSIHAYGDLASGIPFILLTLFPVFFSVATVLENRASGVFAAAREKGEFYLLEFWCLILLAAVNLVLLFFESFAPAFGVMFLPNPLLHDFVSFPFVLALAALLTIESATKRPRLAHVFLLLPVLVALGAVLWLTGALAASPYLAFGVPFVLALLAGGLVGIVSTLRPAPKRAPWGSTVRYVTVVGIAFLLLGVLVSASERTTVTASLGIGDSLVIGNTKLMVQNITTTPSTGKVGMPGYGNVPETVNTVVTYSLDGQSGSTETLLKYYPVSDQFFSVPSIYGSLAQDIYVVAGTTTSINQATGQVFANGGSASPTLVSISVQTIPGIWLVWMGTAIMVLANVPFVLRRGTKLASSAEETS